MNVKSSFLLLVTVSVVCLFSGARQEQPKPSPRGSDSNQALAQRLEQLETRVAILEKILFSTVKLEKTRARRQLEDRERRLKHSRALFAKGMITEAELQQDRMRADEARRELELAVAETNQKQLASELELAEAERNLEIANDELTYRRNMARRGYASKAEIEQLEKARDEAKLYLENAKLKLEAASKLDALNK